MTRKTIPQRLDDLVLWTGIPDLGPRMQPRRRPLRWLSLTAAVLAVAGFVAGALSGFAGPVFWGGYGIVVACFLTGTFMQIFGPLKPFASPVERADEFDRALRARAYLFAFPVFALATVAGLLLLMFMLVTGWPAHALTLCLADLIMLLMALGSAVPVAYASWSVEWDRDEG